MLSTLPKVYKENPNHRMKRVLLSEEVYSQAIEAFIIVCTDAVIVDSKRRTFWLAKRIIKPQPDIWLIGGRRLAGEKPYESICRCFERETTLGFSEGHFSFVTIAEFIWKNRQQFPQEIGCHALSHIFKIELNDSERAICAAALDTNEYDKDFGLCEFNRQKLIETKAHQLLIDLYDLIFL